MRWLGVDAGEARVGIAISDPDGRYSLPLEVVPASAAFPAIRAIVEREQIDGIVLGIARHRSGEEGEAAEMARRLGRRLSKLGVPVEYEDETLTSQGAAWASQTAGRLPGAPVDDIAASLILQQFLDRRARQGEGPGDADA